MQKYKDFVKQFISFKSISTDPQYQEEVKATAEFLISEFAQHGFETELIEGFGNPLVYASFVQNDTYPICLIYGHYDIQPADISEGWNSEPFELTESEGRLFARGAVDNKGQVGVHIATAFELIEQKKLKYNLKFIIEGDEETGSEQLEGFFKKHADLLTCDFVLASDGELTMGHPAIETGFRGFVNFTLTVKTSEKDNHSGLYGGSIPNAASALTKLISKMHDENGVLKIKYIDNFRELPENIVKVNKAIPYSDKEFEKNTGAKTRLNKKNIDAYSQVGLLTSAEVTTLSSGYHGEGYRNAIPGKALAKINFRISPSMNVSQVEMAFKEFIYENSPDYVEWHLEADQQSEPIELDVDNKFIDEAVKVLNEVYKKEVLLKYCGAIVPIAGFFKDYLKVPVLMVPLCNEDCNMHGANENYEISYLEKALEFSRKFLSK